MGRRERTGRVQRSRAGERARAPRGLAAHHRRGGVRLEQSPAQRSQAGERANMPRSRMPVRACGQAHQVR